MDTAALAAQVDAARQTALDRARDRAEEVVTESEDRGGKFSPEAHRLLVDYHARTILASNPLWRGQPIPDTSTKKPETPPATVAKKGDPMFSDMTKEELAQLVADGVKAALAEERAASVKTVADMTSEEFRAHTEKLLRDAETARMNPKEGG